MDRFHSKLVSGTSSVTNTLALINTLAYYEISTFSNYNVIILQAHGPILIELFMSVIQECS
jgi:hypothetical protein